MTAHGSPDRVSLDALLAHREWVRELARRLVTDENVADDVEQETWRMAIERPPRHAESLRGWLAAVVRNAARGVGRRESRRARHEAAVPERRTVPSPEELVAGAEVQARLARAVLELDEPYRSTVLYRYHEGLASTEVAARLGVPVETVRTRLKRAIERLRERMEVELGDDRDAWCLLLLGPRPEGGSTAGSGGGAAWGGGVAMAAGKKLVVGAVIVVVALLSWRGLATDGDRAARDGIRETSDASTASRTTRTRDRKSAGGGTGDAADRPARGELVVSVTAGGVPAAGAAIDVYRLPAAEDSRSFAQTEAGRMTPPAPTSSWRTDVEGSARLQLGVTDAFVVVARKRGFAPESVRFGAGDLVEGESVRLRLTRGHPLSGRLIDGSGHAVGNASLVAAPGLLRSVEGAVAAALSSRATADASGRFAFDDVRAGRVDLWAARPDGVATCAAVVDVPNVTAIDLVLGFDGGLAGVVTDAETGSPLDGAVIEVWSREGDSSCAATATTDAGGIWSVAGLPLDRVSVKATKAGWLPGGPKDEDGRVHLAHGRTTKCDLALRRGVPLSGRIAGPDGPVAGATVTVARASDGSPDRPQTQSAADGTYRFHAVAPGEVFVVVSVDGFCQQGFSASWSDDVRQHRAPREAAVVVPESGEAHLDVQVTHGLVVAGRVLDPDGDPAEHAGVALRFDGCESDGPIRWQQTTTGADGTFRFAGVVATNGASLSAWYRDIGASYDEKVELDPVRGAADVTLKLRRGGRLLVTVSAPDGLDVRDAVIEAISAHAQGDDDAADRWSSAATVGVEADGTAEFPTPPVSAAWVVRAEIPGRARSQRLEIDFDAAGGETRAHLALAAVERMRGIVTTSEGAPVAGAWISVARAIERPRRVAVSSWGNQTFRRGLVDVSAVTDARGRFELEPLDSGKYEVSVAARGFAPATIELEAPSSDEIRVELAPSLGIRGRLHFADGRPAAQVRLSIHVWHDGTPTDTRTDDEGSFAFEGLLDDRYFLSISPLPKGAVVKPLDVGEVRPREEPFDFVLEPALTISGRVVAVDGRPVEGCSIQGYRVGVGPMIDRFAGNHASASSDDDGRFTFSGMSEGSYVLVVVPPRDALPPLLAPLRIDGVVAGTADLRVVVKPGLAIAGHVVDGDARPVTGVEVGLEALKRAGPDPDADVCWAGRLWADVDGAGAFRLEGLPPGRWKVVLLDGRLDRPSGVQVEGDGAVRAGETTLRLVASGARTIAGLFLDASGSAVGGEVELTPAEGGPTQTFRVVDEGKFVFVGLEPGRTYRLVAAPQDRELSPVTLESVAPGRRDVEVRFAVGLRAEGRVLGPDGSPVANALVRLRRETRAFERYTRTGADGRFVAHGLVRGGDYGVQVDIASRTEASKQDWRDCGSVRAGEGSAELRVRR